MEGRKVFANILKYVRMGASSNFGNMFSVLADPNLGQQSALRHRPDRHPDRRGGARAAPEAAAVGPQRADVLHRLDRPMLFAVRLHDVSGNALRVPLSRSARFCRSPRRHTMSKPGDGVTPGCAGRPAPSATTACESSGQMNLIFIITAVASSRFESR